MRPTPFRLAVVVTIVVIAGELILSALRGPDTTNGVPITGAAHTLAVIASLGFVAAATLAVVYVSARGSQAADLSLRNALIIGVLLECAQLVSAQFPVTVTITVAGTMSEQGGGVIRYALELIAVPTAITVVVLYVSKRLRTLGA